MPLSQSQLRMVYEIAKAPGIKRTEQDVEHDVEKGQREKIRGRRGERELKGELSRWEAYCHDAASPTVVKRVLSVVGP